MRGNWGVLVVLVAALLGLPAVAQADEVTLGPATQTVAENAGKVVFTVTRSGVDPLSGADASVTVSLGGAGGTATCPEDVRPCSQTVPLPATFLSTTASADVAFDLVDDTTYEGSEAFTAQITSASGTDASGAQAARATITDDDPPPAVSVGAAAVSEGTGGSATALGFPVTLDQPSARAVTVAYDLTPGSAGGDDVDLTSGTVAVPAGQTRATIPASVSPDAVDEDDESFGVTLRDPVDATLATASARGTILDDDTAGVSVADVTAPEGTGASGFFAFTVTLSTPAAHAVSVGWVTADRSATAPADYAASSGTLTFAPGETSKRIRVTIVGDAVPEGDEAFVLTLRDPVGGALTRDEALAVIRNDDVPPAPGVPAGTPSAPRDTSAPKGTLARLVLKRPRTLRSSLTCPRTEARCTAVVTVFTVPNRKARVRALRKELKLVAVKVAVSGGGRATVSARIPRGLVALLGRAGSTRVAGYAVIRDPAGNVAIARAFGTLRP